jgi:hypothetical protein
MRQYLFAAVAFVVAFLTCSAYANHKHDIERFIDPANRTPTITPRKGAPKEYVAGKPVLTRWGMVSAEDAAFLKAAEQRLEDRKRAEAAAAMVDPDPRRWGGGDVTVRYNPGSSIPRSVRR